MDLSGRGVLITGGKRIGASVAIELARAGADIAIAYNRSADEAREAAAAVEALGRRAPVLQANLSNRSECTRLVDDAAQALGRLDVLVNMASVYVHTAYDELVESDWDRTLAIDLTATHLCTHRAVRYMRKQGGGRVINFTDWIAASGRPRYTGYAPYYVAKMGVIGLTQIQALELAPDHILVNAVAPGPILPPDGTSEDEIASVAQTTPLGRWGGSDEIAKAVRFLVETDFVTGEIIRVDGGRHVK